MEGNIGIAVVGLLVVISYIALWRQIHRQSEMITKQIEILNEATQDSIKYVKNIIPPPITRIETTFQI